MNDPNQQEELRQLLESVRCRLRRLTVAVMLLTLVLVLSVAVTFGELVNYFAFDPLLLGGVTVGAALLGFGFGWYAGRRF